MIERRRILAFSFFPAFVPPNNGGVERLYNFYSHLSQYHDITLISSTFIGAEREVIRHRSSFVEVRVPKDHNFASAYAKLAVSSGAGDISGPALGQASEHHGEIHDEYLEFYSDADIIIHDSPFLINCDLFRGFDNKVRIYNSYNCESDLYSTFHSRDGHSNEIANLVRHLEQELCRHCDLITVCSDDDAMALRQQFGRLAPCTIVPNGFTPGPPFTAVKREDRSVVFLGSAHQPNVDAVRLILDDIAPKMRDLEFHLIGSCHAPGKTRNVTSHGVISEQAKDALLRRASVAINPMINGGGSSLKIADIVNNGCPLISTELGARGFEFEPDVHYISLDREEAVTAIRRVLSDDDLRERISGAAFAHVEGRYSWHSIVASFAKTLQSLTSRTATAPKPKLVLNDYDSLASLGGGATRTRGLCRGLAETSPIIFMAFATGDQSLRRISEDGRILSLLVAKSPQHQAEHELHNRMHWVSTADIVGYRHASDNTRLMSLFRCAASISTTVICEHPYMVGVPRAFGVEFIYSSQNCEFHLKDEGLQGHPLRDELLPLVREAEAFACGASTFIVAVSEGDATDLGAVYRSTAPITVVPNGADGPAKEPDRKRATAEAGERPIAIFMGSVHAPNHAAAQWIVTDLAQSLPQFDFVFVGSIANSVTGPMPANVKLVGEVSALGKTVYLRRACVGLNPMTSGSGSNVKMADYLQHGLVVLTTKFGSRGYEWLPRTDAVVSELDQFSSELCALMTSDRTSEEARHAREMTYASRLSMDAGGRRLAQLIDDHSGSRKRALYVTYRYNDPPRGGGEEYVVRLVHSLAESGWEVDVVSPAAERIVDVGRFAAAFSGPHRQPIPTGVARVRSIKFPLDIDQSSANELRRVWNYQSDYEERVAQALTPPASACLAWGWADPDGSGRWAFQSAGLHLPQAGRLSLTARAPADSWLQIFAPDGRRLRSMQVDGDIALTCDVPSGFISLQTSRNEVSSIEDPRPLALFVTALDVSGCSLLDDRISDDWAAANPALEYMTALAGARAAVRDPHGLDLSPLRSPSELLDQYVRKRVADYDLLIAHNAVFKGTTAAISTAQAAQVPSILIPHLHYDDDFYHFRDVLASCKSASRTLVCPQGVAQLLVDEGLDNVIYHSPGVDVDMAFTDDDEEAFRATLPTPIDEFFLVLGRKAAAKGYQDVFEALRNFPGQHPPVVVMIGPDDDGLIIEDPRVVYLGRQSSAVVRGALRLCLGLINMSRSESFGMVLLQAGLAGKPVLANRNCAAFADIVEDGVTGYLTSRVDLGARMLALQSNPSLRERLGHQARLRALDHDWHDVEQKFVSICSSLASLEQ